MEDELLVYGSYGYTGSLIADHAVATGHSPTLAGRRAEPLERQATDLDCDHRVFSLEHDGVVASRVGGFDAVLNCAGPFSATTEPLVRACLETGTDYLDIAGEIEVLEAVAERDREAEKAGVTLLPGAGFDVVPTDCLAAHLESRLPSATRLELALSASGSLSPGTVKSVVEGLGRPGAVREDGRIRPVPPAWRTREFDFGDGRRTAVTVPWGDVATAYYTTGIPNVETYAVVHERAIAAMRRLRPLTPVLGAAPVQRALKGLADAFVTGPTPAQRAASSARIYGAVENDDGDRVAARLETPGGYDLTARTAVEAARRVLDDDAGDGFQTPASAFGPGFVLDFEGVAREDVAGATLRADGAG